jgi:hypothetical protein
VLSRTLLDMAKSWVIPVALALSIVACSPDDQALVTTTTGETTLPAASPTTTTPLVAGCDDQAEYVEGGTIGVVENPTSDSTTIGTISWDAGDSCEVFTIAFVTGEGAPPTTPPSVRAFYVSQSPIIRLVLDVDSTVITDQLVETKLVERIYAVRALDGGMFIDLHLAAPTQARIELKSSPARLELDLQPGIVEYPSSAATSDFVVLASPLDGAVVSGELEITGYTRTFEANVLVILTAGDHVLAETNTTAADWVETWGEFRTTLAVEPGDVTLFVGDASPDDGSLEGVLIDLAVQ